LILTTLRRHAFQLDHPTKGQRILLVRAIKKVGNSSEIFW